VVNSAAFFETAVAVLSHIPDLEHYFLIMLQRNIAVL